MLEGKVLFMKKLEFLTLTDLKNQTDPDVFISWQFNLDY